MKRIATILIYILLNILITSTAISANGDSINKRISFQERIQAVQNDVVDLTSHFDLLHSESFLEIWRHPSHYRLEALDFLTDLKRTEIQREIAALSMQRLPLNDFVVFCERIVSLRKAEIISPRIFNIAIFPPFDWNTQLVENYKNPKVRRLLNIIDRAGVLSESDNTTINKKYIKKILSGEAMRDLERLREAGQIRSIEK